MKSFRRDDTEVPISSCCDPITEITNNSTSPVTVSGVHLPVTTTVEELEQREKHIKEEQFNVQTSLSEITVGYISTKKALQLLNQKLPALEEEFKVKSELISTNSLRVEALLHDMNCSREEKNRLATDKKNSYCLVLNTELKLRDLQIEVLRQQLIELSNTKLDEIHPTFKSIHENEILVTKLTDEVAVKTALYKESETSYRKAEQLFRQKDEEYKSFAKYQEEALLLYREVRQNLASVKTEIEYAQRNLEKLMNEGKKKYLRSIEIDSENIRIEACKKLLKTERKRKKIEDEEEFSFDRFMPHPTSSVSTTNAATAPLNTTSV